MLVCSYLVAFVAKRAYGRALRFCAGAVEPPSLSPIPKGPKTGDTKLVTLNLLNQSFLTHLSPMSPMSPRFFEESECGTSHQRKPVKKIVSREEINRGRAHPYHPNIPTLFEIPKNLGDIGDIGDSRPNSSTFM
jgi:hypothetical protein